MKQIESYAEKHGSPDFQIGRRWIVCRTPVGYEMENGTKVIPLHELVQNLG